MRRIDDRYWLLNRCSFGFTAADYQNVQTLGYDAWLDAQLQPDAIPDPAADAMLANYPWLNWTPTEMLNDTTRNPWEFGYENQQVRTVRAVLSKRQLFERLVEFWTDHFNVYGFEEPILKVVEDREILRAFVDELARRLDDHPALRRDRVLLHQLHRLSEAEIRAIAAAL